ncbi:MAG TPA: TlpA disulfide reductase family protein [Myxococcales bacterium]|nr:TlpA disulfide reductase family protein [Myxococcales bacterium]
MLLAAASPPAVPVVRTVDEALALEAPGHGLRVLHFWALWCGTCRRDLPSLRRLAAGLDAAGVPLIGLSLDRPDQAQAVEAYAREQRLAFPNAILDAPDPTPITQRLDPAWDADLPATFVVSKSGKTLRAYLGLTPVERVLDDVRRLAGASPPSQEKNP